MLTRLLARLSDTPQFKSGTRAYDVHFRTAEGDDRTAVLTRGDHDVGKQISHVLFSEFPGAIDYTFREFDYLDFQYRIMIDRMSKLALTRMQLDASYGGEIEP